MKATCDKPTANTVHNGDRMKIRSKTRQECPVSSLLVNIVPENLDWAIKQEKEIKDT